MIANKFKMLSQCAHRHLLPTYVLLTFLAVSKCCGIAQGNATGHPLNKQIATPAGASETDGSPSFDVVSIKPNNTGKTGMAGFLNDTYRADGFSIGETILRAYFSPVMRGLIQQIDGFPSWAGSERFDILAKVDENTAVRLQSATLQEREAIVQPMLQKMLAERCGLIVHPASIKVQGYALIVSRRGSKLEQSQLSEVVPQGFKDMGEGGKAHMIGKRGFFPEIDFMHVSTAALAKQLSIMRNMLIVDQTGLTGAYNFKLLPLDEGPIAKNESMQGGDGFENALPWDLGRLGLKLIPMQVKAQSIVIDSIHRPSSN